MTFQKSPHNFLLHLRNHAPWAARLFDGARSLSFIGGVLGLKIDPTLWPGTEVHSRLAELEEEAACFFGVGTRIELADAPRDPEYLPFQVNAGKYWNHVAFATQDSLMHSPRVLAVRKTVYAAKILKTGIQHADPGDIFLFPGNDDVPANLPGLLDRLALLAREGMSYVHFVTPFPGHDLAERLEGRFYSVKEWGTPTTPSGILQKFVGRLHYCDSANPPTGVRLAETFGHSRD